MLIQPLRILCRGGNQEYLPTANSCNVSLSCLPAHHVSICFWVCALLLTRSASTTSSCPRTALQSRRDASCSRQCLSRTSLPSTSRNSSFVNDIDIISSVAIAGCERRLQPFQHHPNAANTSPPASSSGTQHMNMFHSPSRSIGQQGLADQHSFIDATKLDMKTHASNSAMVAIGRRMSLAPLHTGGQSLL